MKKTLVFGLALAGLAMLFWTDTAQARIGWGGGYGGYGHGYSGYGGYNGFYGNGLGWGNNFGYHGYGYPYGYGNYGSFGWNNGYYPSYGYSNYGYPNYQYSTPNYYYSNSPGYNSNGVYYYSTPSFNGTTYTAPANVNGGTAQNVAPTNYQSFYSGPPNDVVRLRVSVPTPDTKVWIEDSATQETGTERVFESPKLVPGKTYTYHLKARWMDNGREVTKEKDVKVQTGQETTVRFDNSDANANSNAILNQNR